MSCLIYKLFLTYVSVMDQSVDEEAEKAKRRKEYVRTYVSPWEKAMKDNEELRATMKPSMPGPVKEHPEMPQYKSFNRYTQQKTCYTLKTVFICDICIKF